MVEADPFQSRQRGAFDTRRPRQEAASLPLQTADDPPPERRRRVVGVQATEPGDTRLHQACEPVQPPCGHRLGDLGPVQPGVGDIQATRRPPRAGRRAAIVLGEPLLLAAANRGIDRDLIDGKVEPDPQSMLRGLARDARDAGIGSARPAQRRVQRLVIGGGEDVAARTRQERRGDADRVESHGAAAREMRRPIRQIAGNQRMEVIDLWCHAVRGSVCSDGPGLRPWNASE